VIVNKSSSGITSPINPGLNYNFYRDFNPVIGRYIEADPIGIDLGKNHLYGYSRNNPIRFTDPFGLWACQQAVLIVPVITVVVVITVLVVMEEQDHTLVSMYVQL
jgi:RHS repeat-associated protein